MSCPGPWDIATLGEEQGVPAGTYIVDANMEPLALVRILAEAVGATSVAGWQDLPERQQADVVDAFDRSILLAEAAR